MTVRVLITGCGGQVGRDVVALAPPWAQVDARDRSALDVTDAAAVAKAVAQADLVINCAAYTAVDKAESEPDAADAVNHQACAHLATACAAGNLPLLHLSTDYVFDGRSRDPIDETLRPAPLGVYGASKLAGEDAIRSICPRHLIIRVSWVFGAHGSNFVKTMRRLATEREHLRVVADQHGRPTPAEAIARMLWALAERCRHRPAPSWGTYHFGAEPVATWHGFARTIVDELARRGPVKARAVEAITTAEFPTPAQRPQNSVLALSRLESVFGIVPADWRRSLERVLE